MSESKPIVIVGDSGKYFTQEIERRSKSLQKLYYRYLSDILIGIGHDSESFYKWVNESLASEDRRVKKDLTHTLCEYVDKRILGGMKFNSVKVFPKAVNFFLKANEVEGYRFKYQPNGATRSVEHSLFTEGADRMNLDEIKEFMNLTGNPRNLSIITMLKDSGLRCGDLAQLRFKHIKEVMKEGTQFIHFEIIPQKNKGIAYSNGGNPLPAQVVIGRDAIHYLMKYLEIRQRNGEVLDDDAYVYVNDRSQKGHTRKTTGSITEAVKGKPMTPQNISYIFNYIKEKGDFKGKLSAHSLRKNFVTSLTGAGVPERWINIMQGRKGQGTQGIYQKPSEEELIAVYRDAYTDLCLDSNSQELEGLKQENEALTLHVNSLESRLNVFEGAIKEILAAQERAKKRTEETVGFSPSWVPASTQPLVEAAKKERAKS